MIGAYRHLLVCETDEEAELLGRPAYDNWYESLSKLWWDNGSQPNRRLIEDFDEARRMGATLAGSPESDSESLEKGEVQPNGSHPPLAFTKPVWFSTSRAR